MNLWDRLLPQAILTLNLLRQANKTPTMSAYQYVNGPLTTMPHRWDRSDAKFNFMRVQTGGEHGTREHLPDGIWAHQWNIIGATKSFAKEHVVSVFRIQYFSNTNT